MLNVILKTYAAYGSCFILLHRKATCGKRASKTNLLNKNFWRLLGIDHRECKRKVSAHNNETRVTLRRLKSHAGTVVPECFKYDNASQWKSGKFAPRTPRNPWTDRYLNLHGWLRQGRMQNFITIRLPPLAPKYAKMRSKWLD